MSQNHRTPARVHRGIDGDLTVQTSLRNKGFPYEFLGLFSHRWFVLCGRLKLVAGRFHPPRHGFDLDYQSVEQFSQVGLILQMPQQVQGPVTLLGG